MVSSAASCFAGVTPAQHEAITLIGVSGMNAFRMRAFETTQMSVQRPMRHISRCFPPSREASLLILSASSTEPNEGLSTM